MKFGVNTFGLGPDLHKDAEAVWAGLLAGGVNVIEPCIAVKKTPPQNAEEQAVWDKGILDGIFDLETAESAILKLRQMGFEVFSFQMQSPVFSADAVAQFIPLMDKMNLHHCIYSFMERSVSTIQTQQAPIRQAIRLLQDHGKTFLVHNHDMEWLPDENTCVMAWLLKEIPELNFELDLGWTEYAGVSSVQMLEAYPERFPLLHIKEIAQDARAWAGVPFCTAPGRGILPLHRILSWVKRHMPDHHTLIIDQDDSVSGNLVADITEGIRTIQHMLPDA